MKRVSTFLILVICLAGCVSQTKNGEIFGKVEFKIPTKIASNHIAILSKFKKNLIMSTYLEISEQQLNSDGSFHFSGVGKGEYSVSIREKGRFAPLVGKDFELTDKPAIVELKIWGFYYD